MKKLIDLFNGKETTNSFKLSLQVDFNNDKENFYCSVEGKNISQLKRQIAEYRLDSVYMNGLLSNETALIFVTAYDNKYSVPFFEKVIKVTVKY